jgi:hypothetical protein
VVLAELGVKLIEQPQPALKDDALLWFQSPVLLCANVQCEGNRMNPPDARLWDDTE